RQREVTLDASHVEVAVERRDEKRRVDVRRDDLRAGRSTSRRPRECRSAFESAMDRGGSLVRANRREHPVTDRRQISGGGCLVAQPSCEATAPLPVCRGNAISLARFPDDARRRPSLSFVVADLPLEKAVPSQVAE